MFTPQATIAVIDNHAASTSTVVLPSRLDVHTVDDVAARVGHILRSGATWLSIDAGDVRHTDRAGLDLIRSLLADLDTRGVSYTVEAMSLTVRIALELNGLHAELTQLDTHLAQLAAA